MIIIAQVKFAEKMTLRPVFKEMSALIYQLRMVNYP
jgi:hypothetical protein